jgi:SH3 domain protein
MKYAVFFISLLSVLLFNSAVAQEQEQEQEQQNLLDTGIDPPDVKEIDAPESDSNDTTPTFTPEVRYVSDEFFVPLRETPCARCKIVHWGIKSGTKVDLIDRRDGWGLVVTTKGYKGWMEEQFIISSPSGRQLLSEKSMQHDQAQISIETLEIKVSELQAQLDAASRSKNELSEGNRKIAKKLADLEDLSSDPVAINQQNQSLVKQNTLLQNENIILKAEIEVLENSQRNQFFFYGVITLFLSVILVSLIPRLKPKKRLSEWG